MTAPTPSTQEQVIILAVIDEPDPIIGVAIAALSDVYEQPFIGAAP